MPRVSERVRIDQTGMVKFTYRIIVLGGISGQIVSLS
jgi:hypothetical protein